MLRMPAFTLHRPRTADEAVALRATPGSFYLAGGTDLLVNLKHGLHDASALVDLSGVPGLSGITEVDGSLRIGALTPLARVAEDPRVAQIPGLQQAVASIAGPQHREMGTLGGNVMLDTRCLFYNQTDAWRTALGRCLKSDGDWCHVIGSPKGCVAAQSSDSVPMLLALGAVLDVRTAPGHTESLALDGLFTKDGRYDRMHTLPREALLEAVRVPLPGPGHRSTYRKVRTRAAVDFPQLGVAVSARFDAGICQDVRIALGALLPTPRLIDDLPEAVGVPWDDAVIAAVAERAFKLAKPQRSVHGDPAWRRAMVRVEVTRALQAVRPERVTSQT